MTVAVTAGSGRLGSAVVRSLQRMATHPVVGLARTPEKAAHLGVEIRRGDHGAPAELEAALRSVDTVLLVSGMDPPAQRIEQHRNVIRAAQNAGVRKIVYTSIQGADTGTTFSPVVQSNRTTERDVRESGLDWVIGRNGIYIEPDVEYVGTYVERGRIANCAGSARCGYTIRSELADAYARMLTEARHAGQTYNLHGEPITQGRLAELLNLAFGTNLTYEEMSVEEYRDDRIAELGEFMGEVIAGIYAGIRAGALDNPSHFVEAAGRPHLGWEEYFAGLRTEAT